MNYDAWLEPPDPAPCDDGCTLEDEHDTCYTVDDFRADEGDREYDRITDGDYAERDA